MIDRFFGYSFPQPEEDAIHFIQHLNMEQALQDLIRFTTSVELPIPVLQANYSPDNSPWIAIGCSYPGTLAAMLQKYYPGTFAASVASCAPLHVSGNYWQYWKAIEEVLPRDCSSDLQMIVAHLDKLVSEHVTQDEIDTFMARFEGRENLEIPLDVIWRFEEPVTLWQVNMSSTFQLCDALLRHAESFPEKPRDLELALDGLAAWEREFKGEDDPNELSGERTPLETEEMLEYYYAPFDRTSWLWLQCVRMVVPQSVVVNNGVHCSPDTNDGNV